MSNFAIIIPDVPYDGGTRYFNNLIKILQEQDTHNKLIIITSPGHVGLENSNFKHVTASFLKRGHFNWFIDKLFTRLTGWSPFLYLFCWFYEINWVSHSPFPQGKHSFWLPDLQYKLLPEVWPKDTLRKYEKYVSQRLKHCDELILSSESTKTDFKKYYPNFRKRIKVLKFHNSISKVSEKGPSSKIARFLREKYIFIPNQFWSHKNYEVVIEAMKLTTHNGQCPIILCTGSPMDLKSRDTAYHDKIMQLVMDYNLVNNFIYLGRVSDDDMIHLYNNAKYLLNPSRFEGWNSSVEEAKSINLPCILSDIAVHREQTHNMSNYFSVDDHEELAQYFMNLEELNQFSSYDDIIIEQKKIISDTFWN